MRGEFIGVWSESWREIWLPLIDDDEEDSNEVPEDIFCELYRALVEEVEALKTKPSVEERADILDDPLQSRKAFENTSSEDIHGERALVRFLEEAHSSLEELGGDILTDRYFSLLSCFIEKYSLRYDLRRPCKLCPTLPGVFATLVRNLQSVAHQDDHLHGLLNEFEEAVCDLRDDSSEGRIKTCIQKQVNLLEALGCTLPGVTKNTLGDICNEVGTWPHNNVKEAVKSIYRFASDYPGIRHGGTPTNALRSIELRDLVAVSILLAGFTPYLTDQLDVEAVYRGS